MMERLTLPRPVWIGLHLALILLLGWLTAGILNGLVLSIMAAPIPSKPSVYASSSSGSAPLSFRDYTDIIRNNMFNPAAVGMEPGLGTSATGSGGARTSLSLKLLGTMTWGPVRLAIIQTGPSPDSEMVFRLNEMAGGAEIVSIERNRVGLMNNGRLEILEVDFAMEGAAPGGAGAGPRAMLGGEDVVKTGDGAAISQRYLDGQLKNMNQLLTQVRAVPNMDESGNTNGFKLFSIQAGSIYEKIGLANQDVVQRINGVDLNSAEKGLELFQALRNEKSFNVDIMRGNQKTTLRFNIQ